MKTPLRRSARSGFLAVSIAVPAHLPGPGKHRRNRNTPKPPPTDPTQRAIAQPQPATKKNPPQQPQAQDSRQRLRLTRIRPLRASNPVREDVTRVGNRVWERA